MSLPFAGACLVTTLLAGILSAQARNIVLVIADDVGVYELECYAEGSDPAVTPVLNTLAAGGVLFRNCWANPLCTPTRATIQTGRHALHTGVGAQLTAEWDLRQSEVTLAEALRFAPHRYTTGYFGKWHLSNESGGGFLGPNLQGYHHAIWTTHNLVPPDEDYRHWLQVENGIQLHQKGYITTHTVERALEFAAVAPEPWFAVIAFHAPHAPFHVPPAGLYTTDVSAAKRAGQRPLFKAMIEAMDAELGRFVLALEALQKSADLVFVGDNGSPGRVIGPPGTDDTDKGTLYEGGINVPLIIHGPSVSAPGSECAALVHTTDLFATVLELAGLSIPPEVSTALKLDSTSLVPYLGNPALPSLRATVYSEWFLPSGFEATDYKGAVRNERFKLQVHYPPATVRLFDLVNDPLENLNLLLAPLSPEAHAAFNSLGNELLAKVLSYGP